MKKGRGKKKFVELDLNKINNNDNYIKKQNNNTFSKEESKKKSEFKSSLDKLIFLFPNFSSDLVKEVYEENENNYSKTKDMLRQLSEEEFGIGNDNCINNQNNQNFNNNENVVNNNDMIIEENIIDQISKDNNQNNNGKNNDSKNKNNIDITHYAKFEVVSNNEFEKVPKTENKINNNNKKENNINDSYNKIEKIKEHYNSLFNDEQNDNNSNIYNNNCRPKEEITIEDYLFDQNIEFLSECFPNYTREQIVKKICDNNFDIDSVILNLLKETNLYIKETEDDYANIEITDRDEILSNFIPYDSDNQNDFDIEQFKENLVQKEIEEMIKKENNKKHNNLYDDDDMGYQNIQDSKGEGEKEEFFLYKRIDEIKTPKIKEDLKKLIYHFPLEDEFNIKLVYYQYNDYNLSYQYFSNKDGSKVIGLKSLIDSLNNKSNFAYTNGNSNNVKRYNNKPKKESNKNNENEEKRQYEIFKKIIDNKPINWRFEDEKNINLNDYIAVRKRLFLEAKNAYANKKPKDGQILMARAKRYQQEIDKIYKKQRINILLNADNNSTNEIDLHGLTLPESKYIIDKKIQTLKEKKIEYNLKSHTIVIVTGTGSHSAGHKSILYPNLMEWLKNREKLGVKGDLDKGQIFVTIY